MFPNVFQGKDLGIESLSTADHSREDNAKQHGRITRNLQKNEEVSLSFFFFWINRLKMTNLDLF